MNLPLDKKTVPGEQLVEVKDISDFGITAINSNLFNPRMTLRTKKRLAMQLLTAAQVYCNQLVDRWFKYVDKNRNDVAGYGELLLELDKTWRNYIRARSDKSDYEVCGPVFIQKMNFLIGNKEELQSEFEKIKNSENNFGNEEGTTLPLN